MVVDVGFEPTSPIMGTGYQPARFDHSRNLRFLEEHRGTDPRCLTNPRLSRPVALHVRYAPSLNIILEHMSDVHGGPSRTRTETQLSTTSKDAGYTNSPKRPLCTFSLFWTYLRYSRDTR